MPDDQTQAQASGVNPPAAGLSVPAETQQQFPDVIDLIRGSESMNDEERQYWVNILPIMTPEQRQNLKEILENEKKQLAAIDAKYSEEIQKMGQTELIAQTEAERRKRRESRSFAEAAHKETEDQTAEDLLKKIEGA